MAYYDRYSRFKASGNNYRIVPFIKLEETPSDIHIVFDKSKMRMDMLSYKYYGSADYGWLIMLANPRLGSLEYAIKDGVQMRIPYPLDSALGRYEGGVNKYLNKHR